MLVQYCFLYQLVRNCYGGSADAEYLDIKYFNAFREVGTLVILL